MNVAKINWLSEIKSLTPEERYSILLDKTPGNFSTGSSLYIASFPDIEPLSLSRLRKRITQITPLNFLTTVK